jgi:hypothetical protein
MTGLERNSDVVAMSSYAPLFGHEEAWQWRPNLIWFDSLNSYATPNYYVQQLFSQNRGDEVLPVKIDDSRPVEPPSGRVGLATVGANAEFKDIRVADKDEVLLDAEQVPDPQKTTTFRGHWEKKSGVVRQTDASATGRMLFGDPSWRDYVMTLKARRLSDSGGIGFIVRSGAGGSYIQWNLGEPGDDKQFALHANLASHSEERHIAASAPGSIEANEWCDVKIEVAGPRVRCFLNGQLIHDVEAPMPDLPRLYIAASRDDKTHQVMLKVVNPTDSATSAELDLAGVGQLTETGQTTVLHGSADDENSLGEPNKIAPASGSLTVSGPTFQYDFLPQSLTVMRIGLK